jgi:hypothetical protein
MTPPHCRLIVVMTNNGSVGYCEQIIQGQKSIESTLLDRMLEHLNAEIAVGTVVRYCCTSSYTTYDDARGEICLCNILIEQRRYSGGMDEKYILLCSIENESIPLSFTCTR